MFDQTPTSPWYTDNANDDWYSYYTANLNYIYLNSPPIADTYLINDTTVPLPDRLAIDFACTVGSLGGAGVYFASTLGSLDQDSYLFKVSHATQNVRLYRCTGGITAPLSPSYNYAIGSQELNYFRIRFFPVDYQIETGISVGSVAGKFIFYGGTDYQQLTELGTFTDPAPITVGSYHGLYIDNTCPANYPRFHMYTFADDWYPAILDVKVHHTLRGPSPLSVAIPKGQYYKWDAWDKGDLIQVFVFDDDGEGTTLEVLNFFGSLFDVRQHGNDIVLLNAYSNMMFLKNYVHDINNFSGLSTGLGSYSLGYPGGESYGGTYPVHRYLNRLDMKPGAVTFTNKDIQGTTDLDMLKEVALVEDYYMFYTPTAKFKFTDIWEDKTTKYLDVGSNPTRFLAMDHIEPISQMCNTAVVYRAGGVRSIAPTPNAANIAKYGTQLGMYGQRIDLHVSDATEANAVSQTIVDRYGSDTYVLDIYFLARWFDVFPGDRVTMSLPQMGIGGTPVGSHSTWTPVTVAILEQEWSLNNPVVRLRVNATWDDSGTEKGYQKFQNYVGDMLLNTDGHVNRADASHV